MDMTAGGIALPENERSMILDQRILVMTAQGGRLESRTATQAVLRTGKPVNHVLHLLLTLFCCTLWIPVWLFVTLSGGERTILVTVDPYGNDRSYKQDLSSGTKTTLAIIAVLWIVLLGVALNFAYSLFGGSTHNSAYRSPRTTEAPPLDGYVNFPPGYFMVRINDLSRLFPHAPVCEPTGTGLLNISINGATSDRTLVVLINDGDDPTVNLVDLGSVNGVRMKYEEGREGASAEISKAGRAYIIKGTAQGFEGDRPVDPPITADFGITVACP